MSRSSGQGDREEGSHSLLSLQAPEKLWSLQGKFNHFFGSHPEDSRATVTGVPVVIDICGIS